jgi:hypothetical protein
MSDTHRADTREPAERKFAYRGACCPDAPHGHDPLYTYDLREAKLAGTLAGAQAADASLAELRAALTGGQA